MSHEEADPTEADDEAFFEAMKQTNADIEAGLITFDYEKIAAACDEARRYRLECEEREREQRRSK